MPISSGKLAAPEELKRKIISGDAGLSPRAK
jgi:hypothetical protein